MKYHDGREELGQEKRLNVLIESTKKGLRESFYEKEKRMAAQGKADKHINEIRCQRCKGRMTFEKFYGGNEVFFGWHCVMCGDILDAVILLHRLSRNPSLVIPEGEEELRSLIRKYAHARIKGLKIENKDNLAAGNGPSPEGE